MLSGIQGVFNLPATIFEKFASNSLSTTRDYFLNTALASARAKLPRIQLFHYQVVCKAEQNYKSVFHLTKVMHVTFGVMVE